MAATVGLLFILLAVCSFSPGFLVVRRLRWNPLEKLCGAIGVSLIFLYLVAGALYCIKPADWRVPCLAVSGVCLALGIAGMRDIRRLTGSPAVRCALFAFAFLTVWMFAIQSIIRIYSGGGWAGDWLEHFQRTLYFLQNFPPQTPVYTDYTLPARPPMMNLLGAFFLAQVGDRFELYQVTFLFLNLLVFLPCCLLAPLLTPRGRVRILPVTALFALCPLLIENITYTATKLLVAFYVILALRFYITGWRKQDSLRITAAFVFLAAGMLVHYSAGPYLVFIALHYVVVVFRRRPRWGQLAAAAVSSGALLATWIVWSILVYGAGETFGSNTSVTGTRSAQGNNLAKVSANLFDTIVPHPLRTDASMEIYGQASEFGRFRDWVFLINQTNLIFAVGSIGGFLLLFLLYRLLRPPADPRQLPVRWFWIGFILFGIVVGVAVHGERDLFGVAHVTLQTLVVLGVACLAANFPSLPRAAAYLLVAGCAIDFAVGMAPNIWLQHLENTSDKTVYLDFPTLSSGSGPPMTFSVSTWSNWYSKHELTLSTLWMEQLGRTAPSGTTDDRQAMLQKHRDFDTQYWRGWYARHGGSLTFLGDHVAEGLPGGSTLPMILVVAMFGGLMAMLIREGRRPQPPGAAPDHRPTRPSRQKAGRKTRRPARASGLAL